MSRWLAAALLGAALGVGGCASTPANPDDPLEGYNRAKAIIETYDQSRQVADALAILVKCYHELGQDKLSADAERVLKLNFPNHASLSGDWPSWRSNWWKLIPLSNRGAKSVVKND